MSRTPASECLFLPELQSDMNDEQLEREFRGFVGFVSCRTRFDRNGKLVGFVEFEATEQAVRARESMQERWLIHFSNNTKSAPKRPREDSGPPSRSTAPRTGTFVREPHAGYIQQPPTAMPPPSTPSYPAPPAPMAASPYSQPPMPTYTPPPQGGYPPPGQQMGHPPPNYLQPLPADASSCLYIEGLPQDATEREISHIFRRFEGQGYQSIRLIPKESSKSGGKLYLCFVEFDNAHQATSALHQLQGYRVDRNVDAPGIRISYSNKSRRAPVTARQPSAGGGGRPPPPPSSSRVESRDERDRGRDRNDDRSYEDRSDYGHRRDGREHRDGHDYAQSEDGDDDYIARADQPVSELGDMDS